MYQHNFILLFQTRHQPSTKMFPQRCDNLSSRQPKQVTRSNSKKKKTEVNVKGIKLEKNEV
jgi:hypothetical protein